MAESVVIRNSSDPVNVLLVEDDDGDAKAVKRAFSKAKIANTIYRVVDGVEALAVLRGEDGREKIPTPHLLLVDLNMPRMNGIQLVEELRKDPLLKRSVVFILTTSKSEEDKLKAYELNVAGYILKKTAGQDFLRLASLVNNYWQIVELP